MQLLRACPFGALAAVCGAAHVTGVESRHGQCAVPDRWPSAVAMCGAWTLLAPLMLSNCLLPFSSWRPAPQLLAWCGGALHAQAVGASNRGCAKRCLAHHCSAQRACCCMRGVLARAARIGAPLPHCTPSDTLPPCAGHPEFHIHSGESAVIAPRPVGGLARRPVAAVAAAKHHTAAALATGELFTWGCNRDGRLGYPAPDTQATPRRCALLCMVARWDPRRRAPHPVF